MQLIGVNRSPFTRRVAITLHVYGISFQQRSLSGFGDREAVRTLNPLGRIPALVLDDGEVLLDSNAIVDHLDEVHGYDLRLIPTSGGDRRAVLKLAAIAMGACDKGLQAAYERNHHPPTSCTNRGLIIVLPRSRARCPISRSRSCRARPTSF